jgi:hypothetical protein
MDDEVWTAPDDEPDDTDDSAALSVLPKPLFSAAMLPPLADDMGSLRNKCDECDVAEVVLLMWERRSVWEREKEPTLDAMLLVDAAVVRAEPELPASAALGVGPSVRGVGSPKFVN